VEIAVVSARHGGRHERRNNTSATVNQSARKGNERERRIRILTPQVSPQLPSCAEPEPVQLAPRNHGYRAMRGRMGCTQGGAFLGARETGAKVVH
jgi:hypothetical protein